MSLPAEPSGPAYYNEHDAFAAETLRQLILAGEIAPGDVDERSLEDVAPAELVRYRQRHFFAGVGVWSAALRGAGWPDDEPVVTGSCPCQPFSPAGKMLGIADERHLWPAFSWHIFFGEPCPVLGEQVARGEGLDWLDHVCADLEDAGYAVGAVDLCACGFDKDHIRQRLYWMAQPAHIGREWGRGAWGRGIGYADDGGSGELADCKGFGGRPLGTPRASEAWSAGGVGRGGPVCGMDDSGGVGRGAWRDGDHGGDVGLVADAGVADRELADANSYGRAARIVGPASRGYRGSVDADGGSGELAESGIAAGEWDAGEVSRAQARVGGARQQYGGVPDRLWDGGADVELACAGGVVGDTGGVGVAGPAGGGGVRAGVRLGELRHPGFLPVGGRARDWVLCRDRRGPRWRPVEPGTSPLADGAEARVGRLRGYGNALDLDTATAFCKAVMAARGDVVR